MNSKSKIYLEQHRMNACGYTVRKLVNRVLPAVGVTLKREEVQKLMTDTPGLSIEITEAKK